MPATDDALTDEATSSELTVNVDAEVAESAEELANVVWSDEDVVTDSEELKAGRRMTFPISAVGQGVKLARRPDLQGVVNSVSPTQYSPPMLL